MPKPKPTAPLKQRKRRPATTPENRENQLISLSYDLVEQRLLDGTASPSETVHFLRLGSTKERIEKEILERQKELITAKTESLQSSKRSEEFYERVIEAMKLYGGFGGDEDLY